MEILTNDTIKDLGAVRGMEEEEGAMEESSDFPEADNDVVAYIGALVDMAKNKSFAQFMDIWKRQMSDPLSEARLRTNILYFFATHRIAFTVTRRVGPIAHYEVVTTSPSTLFEHEQGPLVHAQEIGDSASTRSPLMHLYFVLRNLVKGTF